MNFSCSKGWDYVMVLAAGHWPCDHFSATRSMSALDDVAWSWLPATGRATCPGGQGVASGKGATEHRWWEPTASTIWQMRKAEVYCQDLLGAFVFLQLFAH